MKKLLVLVLAAAMMLGCSASAFANASPVTPHVYYSSASSVKAAYVDVTDGNAVHGNWSYDAAADTWTCKRNDGTQMAGGWFLVRSADGKAQWYLFDEAGKMLTGWVWTKSANGTVRCYYLNPVSNGFRGACYLNGKTPDGWMVDASGAWTVNGVVQTK